MKKNLFLGIDLDKIQKLKSSEEKLLIKNMKKGSIEARNELIKNNLIVVKSIIDESDVEKQNIDDFTGNLLIYLIKGIEEYPENYRYRLTHFLNEYIYKQIKKENKKFFIELENLKEYENQLINDYTAIDILIEEENEKLLKDNFSKLRINYQFVLNRRFGLIDNKPMTLGQIAIITKLTNPRIDAISKTALHELRRKPNMNELRHTLIKKYK